MQHSSTFCECKVGRIATQYDLPNLVSELERRRDDAEMSLRDLRDVFNQRLVERALDENGVDVIADPDAIYGVLYADDASTGRTREVEHRLGADGVDVDALKDAFVSHVTIRNHFVECLEQSTARDDPPTPNETLALIEWSRARDESTITNAIQRLASTDALTVGDIDVNHAVRVTCETCGDHYRVDELIESSGCGCQPTT